MDEGSPVREQGTTLVGGTPERVETSPAETALRRALVPERHRSKEYQY